MDHFERIACTLLEREGYWARQSFKVLLTPKQKAYLEMARQWRGLAAKATTMDAISLGPPTITD